MQRISKNLYLFAAPCNVYVLIGAATSTTPEGPFEPAGDKPLVCQNGEGGSIDPATFVDDDGQSYLLWKNDGKYYLFYSANAYNDQRYAVGVAVADQVMGPYTRQEKPWIKTNVGAGTATCTLRPLNGRMGCRSLRLTNETQFHCPDNIKGDNLQ